MKILSRYVFREILTSSFLATALATFVIFLQGIGKLFELLVRSAKGPAVLELFALSLPPILLLSMPFGVLVGILVGLGRLSSDNEVIAMRSAGVSSRIVVAPVLTFAFAAMLLSGAVRGMAESSGDPGGIQNPQHGGGSAVDGRCRASRLRRPIHERQHGALRQRREVRKRAGSGLDRRVHRRSHAARGAKDGSEGRATGAEGDCRP